MAKPAVGTDGKPDWDENGKPRYFQCKEYRHLWKDCPKTTTCGVTRSESVERQLDFDVYPGTINNQPVQRILVDPCCTMSQVHPHWLPTPIVPTGTTWLKGTNTTVQYPLTKVKVRVCNRTIRIQAAVREDQDFDAILGLDVDHIRALLAQDNCWPTNAEDCKTDEGAKSKDSTDGSTEESSDPEVRSNHQPRRRKRKQPARC